MAKQRDDHNQPGKKKEEPSDVHPLDDLEVIEEAEEPQEIMELGEDDMVELEAPSKVVPATPPAPPAAPGDLKKTKLARKGSVPTMLAPQGEMERHQGSPLPHSPPPKIPNLSLDEPASPPRKKPDDLVDLEAASSEEEVLDILEAAPTPRPDSEVIASEFPNDEPRQARQGDSDVLDLVEAESVSGVQPPLPSPSSSATPPPSVPPPSDVVEISSDVVAAEPVEEIGESASDVVDILEVESAPGSAVAAESDELQPASDILDLGEDDPSPREMASDIFSAEEETPSLMGEESASQGESILDDQPKPRPPEMASDIFSAESILGEEALPAGSGAKQESEDVLDEAETASAGSSVVNWDDVEAGSGARETEKTKGEIDLESTLAFEKAESKVEKREGELLAVEDLDEVSADKQTKPLSGVDPVAEALESGVKLETPKGKKKKKDKTEAEEVDFENLPPPGVEASAVDLGGPPSKEDEEAAEEVDEAPLYDAETELDLASMANAEEAEDVEEALSDDAQTEMVDAEDLLEEVDLLETGEAPVALKGKKKKTAEEEAEDMLLGEDDLSGAEDFEEVMPAEEAMTFDDEAPLPPKKGRKAAARDEEDLVPVGPPPRKKKKRYDEDDDRPVPVSTLTRKPPKPKYGRRWLGGTLLGLLLATGGAGAVWYFAPELLDEIPQSPNAKEKVKAETGEVSLAEADKLRKDKEEALKSAKTAGDVKTGLEEKLTEKTKEITDPDSGWEKKLKDRDAALAELRTAFGDESGVPKDLAKLDLKAFITAMEELEKKHKDYGEVSDLLKDPKKVPKKDPIGDRAKELKSFLIAKEDLKLGLEQLETLLDKKIVDKDDLKKEIAAAATKVGKLLDDYMKAGEHRDALKGDLLSVYKVLMKADVAKKKKGDPTEEEARGDLVSAVEEALRRSENPLAVPLGGLAKGIHDLPWGLNDLLFEGIKAGEKAGKLAYFNSREKFVLGPDKNVDLHIAHLQDWSPSAPKEMIETAKKEAGWLLSKEAESSEELQAKAHYVLGLIHRAKGEFKEAVESFSAAQKTLEGLKSPLASRVQDSYDDLTLPKHHFLKRAEQFSAKGDHKKASAEIEIGLKAMPNNPHLLVARSLTRLESFSKEDEIKIREDADAAVKDKETEPLALYALGQLEAKLGNISLAKDNFRKGLDLVKDAKGEESAKLAGKIKIALGHLLLRDRTSEAEATPRRIEGTGAIELKAKEVSMMPSPEELAVLLVVATLPPPEEETEKTKEMLREEIAESIKIADELIDTKNPKLMGEGFLLKGKAFFLDGKMNKGLFFYAHGIELLNPKLGDDLIGMIKNHPILNYPDPDPLGNRYVAEDHFGRGLHHYWSREYKKAEAAFYQAVGWYFDDPRYHYFYGLALHAQRFDKTEGKKKADLALIAFQMGSKKEAKYLPRSREDVNLSLERIQGELRRLIEDQRPDAITFLRPPKVAEKD